MVSNPLYEWLGESVVHCTEVVKMFSFFYACGVLVCGGARGAWGAVGPARAGANRASFLFGATMSLRGVVVT